LEVANTMWAFCIQSYPVDLWSKQSVFFGVSGFTSFHIVFTTFHRSHLGTWQEPSREGKWDWEMSRWADVASRSNRFSATECNQSSHPDDSRVLSVVCSESLWSDISLVWPVTGSMILQCSNCRSWACLSSSTALWSSHTLTWLNYIDLYWIARFSQLTYLTLVSHKMQFKDV
jgi:hypothetical protein